ncbi:transferrin receptor-like dimerization domain containing protein [Nitzschia inconspicua]|uniref:Transferrin receptor-like dimerization domain containing protein n=1 Tax=Nitzschia inconspicua TaxID=303405 RepID=A0A9K3KKM1_9STRA|nr:transferrin receptor-like dimerization domain containing protein [Nitzschia inconspicua]
MTWLRHPSLGYGILFVILVSVVLPFIFSAVNSQIGRRRYGSNPTIRQRPLSSSFSDDEEIFLSVPSTDSARSSLYFITRQPHVAGTEGDKLVADFVATEFQQAGIPNVTTFDLKVLLNYPRNPPSLELVEASVETEMEQLNRNNSDRFEKRHPSPKLIYKATLSEDILDPSIDDTTDTIWRNRTFHGYSPSGTIEQKHVIYANYGRPQDFKLLEQAGVSVHDRVVLVRYGECFRGLKVRNAQERGAVAVLIYSDPADDGYTIGPVYPEGPWRPSNGIQRGSVQFNSACAGDPLRADPRYRTLLNTSVQELCGVDSIHELIPSIPSIPLSYRDALPLLHNLGGPVAADISIDFVGGLGNLTYHVGPSRGVVNLIVDNEDSVRDIPNVVGVIPGSLPPEKDMPVLLGNHRDAWVYGAADPNSGTAALIEVARGLGRLYTEHNWRPLRTIYLLSWSGEEYGLLGSTGWAELHPFLLKRALVYLNTDTVVSGDHLSVSASPSLISLWKQVLGDLTTTSSSSSDHMERRQLQHKLHFANPPYGEIRDANTNWEMQKTRGGEDDWKIGVLGSGSDYTVFLDHFGIPSMDFSFGKSTGHYGQYHSIYDSFAWMDQFGGRDGERGSAFDLMAFAAKIWGVLAIRMATSEIVPLDLIVQGQALTKYTTHIEDQVKSSDELKLQNLTSAVDSYKQAAAKLHLKCKNNHQEPQAQFRSMIESRYKIDDCNEKIAMSERRFLSNDGLPRRPWFKHVLQAPGMDLGYAAEAFPGIQQALDEKNFALAQVQLDVTADRIQAAATFLSESIL